jgi:hypothetical protein
MGFFQDQEKRLATRYLVWQYQRSNHLIPPTQELNRQAAKIVEDAHRIARKTGRNVLSIMKELVENLKKK